MLGATLFRVRRRLLEGEPAGTFGSKLRWALVLPAAFGGMCAAFLVLVLFEGILRHYGLDFRSPWLGTLFVLIGAYCAALAGAIVAPRRRVQLVSVFALGLACFMAAVLLSDLRHGISVHSVAAASQYFAPPIGALLSAPVARRWPSPSLQRTAFGRC